MKPNEDVRLERVREALALDLGELQGKVDLFMMVSLRHVGAAEGSGRCLVTMNGGVWGCATSCTMREVCLYVYHH